MEVESFTDMQKNPFDELANNESLYIDDPKKALKNWFEREGYELEFKVEEKGYAQFHCEDDFYDSDEDEVLDRTGDFEGRRKRRMRMAEVGKDTIETNDTLVKKHDEFEKEILEVKVEESFGA